MEAEKIEVPTCPYCGQDVREIKSRAVAVGQAIVQMLWCGNTDCRKLLPLQVVGQVEQKRIALPGLTAIPGRH